jgi:hypothetical protein
MSTRKRWSGLGFSLLVVLAIVAVVSSASAVSIDPPPPPPPPPQPPAAAPPGATLTANRDRLLGTLAARKGTDTCTLWSGLNLAERYVFLTTTASLESPTLSSLPDGSVDLDHATTLYTINGPNGSSCGGFDFNRIFVGMDGYATPFVRGFANGTQGDGQWGYTGDPCGPHFPFDAREAIWWDACSPSILLAFACDVPGLVWEAVAPERHHWSGDGCFSASEINARRGMCGVSDPSIVEVTFAYNCTHDADPLCNYSDGPGFDIVTSHVGIDPQYAYIPSGCAASAPVNSDVHGGGTFGGMGPSCGQQDSDCNPCTTQCVCNVVPPLAIDIIQAFLNATVAIETGQAWTCPAVGLFWAIKDAASSSFGCIDKTDCGVGECCDPDTGVCAPATEFADGCFDDPTLGVEFGIGAGGGACGIGVCGAACGCGVGCGGGCGPACAACAACGICGICGVACGIEFSRAAVRRR